MSFVFALFVNCTQIQHIFHTIVWLLHYLFLSLYSKSDNSNAGQFQLVIYLPNSMAKTAKKLLAWNVIVLFLLFSLGLPIEKRMMYKGNTPLVDRLSFTLSESTKTYDLSDIDRYFYIGGSVDYFFLYDKSKDSVEIIPKNECGNISRTPFYWEDLWKSETHINSSQKVRKRQDFKH